MRTIKKIALTCLALMMIISLVACGGPQKQVAPKGDNLIVTPSAAWKEVKSTTMSHYTNGTLSMIITWDKTDETDINKYISNMQTKYASEYENTNFEPVDDYTVAGVPFKRLKFTAKILNMEMKYNYLFAIKNGHIYTITLADVQKTFEESQPMFYNILKTAKFA